MKNKLKQEPPENLKESPGTSRNLQEVFNLFKRNLKKQHPPKHSANLFKKVPDQFRFLEAGQVWFGWNTWSLSNLVIMYQPIFTLIENNLITNFRSHEMDKIVTKMLKSSLFEDIFDFLTWKTYIWILDGKFISLIQPMQSCRIIFEMNAWFGQKLAIFFPAIRFELKKEKILLLFSFFDSDFISWSSVLGSLLQYWLIDMEVLNFEYLLLFSWGRRTWKNQNKYSIF